MNDIRNLLGTLIVAVLVLALTDAPPVVIALVLAIVIALWLVVLALQLWFHSPHTGTALLRFEHRHGHDEHGRSQHVHWAEIDVHNYGEVEAADVVVRIVDKMTDLEWDAETGERRRTIDAFAPVTLGWTSGRDREDIPAGDSRGLLLAYSDAPDTRPTFVNSLPTPTVLHHSFRYRITVRVSAPAVQPVEERYYLETHGQEATRDESGAIQLRGGRSPAIEFELWRDWFEAHRAARRDHLISNLDLIRREGTALLERSHGSRQSDPTFEDDYNDWRARAVQWIETECGPGKAGRFESDSGVRAPAGGTYLDFLHHAERLSARLITLSKFIEELDQT